MHQPVDDNMSELDIAVKEKTMLMAEYFIKLSMYHNNGVNAYLKNMNVYDKLLDNEYFYVKKRTTNCDAMVYLMDKHVMSNQIRLSEYEVRWFTSYQYEEGKYLSVEIEFNGQGRAISACIEITDYASHLMNYILWEDASFTQHDRLMAVVDGVSNFFNDVDGIIRIFVDKKNKVILDDFNRVYSEKIGAPHIHVPLEASALFQ